MKSWFFISIIAIFFSACGGGGGDTKSTSAQQTPSYLQDINTSVAIRFLNKTTFGATQEDIKQLQQLGVEKWLDKEFTTPLQRDIYLKKMITIAKQCEGDTFNATLEEYLADNDTVFNKEKASFKSPRYRLSSWFDNALMAKDQLRHKVAYALSQIIVESDFEPIFTRRAEALARYFDILYANAFGSYKQLLRTISLNSGMGMFLTFNGNQKLYYNEAGVAVYPDENYAREIMQLFSIGLNKLTIDATPQRDKDGHLIPTYTQEDVNQLARVFTGWDLKRNSKFGRVGFLQGDLTHPLEFTAKYHDFGAKELLGEHIQGNLEAKEDIYRAIDIIMAQKSVAPYISKNLIMRLSKTNPSKEYIARVATVFQNTQGDLKAVTKAIFLDPELWDDLKHNTPVKFKEPLIAYTQFLRAFKAQPFPKWYYCGYGGPEDENATNCSVVHNSFLFNDTRSYLAQGAGLAPTVFNFYDNDFIPNDSAFQAQNLYAPELQIQSDTMIINYSNKIQDILEHWEKGYILEHYYKDDEGVYHKYTSLDEYVQQAPRTKNIPLYYIGSDKMLLDATEEYNVLEMVIDGDTDGDFTNLQDYRVTEYHGDEQALKALISFENQKLTGGFLTQEQEDIIFNALKNKIYNKYNNQEGASNPQSKKFQLYKNVIIPVIRAIVTSDSYMVE